MHGWRSGSQPWALGVRNHVFETVVYYMRILSASAVLGVLYGVSYGTRPIRPIL